VEEGRVEEGKVEDEVQKEVHEGKWQEGKVHHVEGAVRSEGVLGERGKLEGGGCVWGQRMREQEMR
jgi:hypothetical protein